MGHFRSRPADDAYDCGRRPFVWSVFLSVFVVHLIVVGLSTSITMS
jgi:hypothetical protein